MDQNELRQEILFGLENLEKIYINISNFTQQNISEEVKVTALTYECFGYYNAIEHIIIRVLKYLRIGIPSGKFSHRDTLRTFETVVNEDHIEIDEDLIKIVENLMAFHMLRQRFIVFL